MMTAWYEHWFQGAVALETAQANAGERPLTAQELEALQDDGGMVPAPRTQGTPKSPTPIVFSSMDITGDRAVIQYDSGAAFMEATLIRRDGRWLVAGRKALYIHF
jgi:hypothetical protein